MNSNEYPAALWGILALAFTAILAIFIFENRKLKAELQKDLENKSLKVASNFAWFANINFLFLAALFFLIVCFYDWQIRDLKKQIQIFKTIHSINANTEKHEKPQETQAHQANLWDEQVYLEPLNKKNEETSSENSIQDIFGVNSNQKDAVAGTDNTKSRYEELLVNYMLMQKCEKAGSNDYQVIITSLQKEMTEILAPAQLQNDIITAARGSYDELYSQISCTDPSIDSAAIQYQTYISSLAAKMPPR